LRLNKKDLRKVMVEGCPNRDSSFCDKDDCKNCEDINYQRDLVLNYLHGEPLETIQGNKILEELG
jgi:hypothetical protein